MRRLALSLFAAALLLVAAATASHAAILVNTDFDTTSGNWSLGRPDNLALADSGDPFHGTVLADTTSSGGLWAYNTTPLPLMLTIDLDYKLTSTTSTDPLLIGFHVWGSQEEPLSPVSGSLLEHNGYFIAITGGEAPPQQKIQILRRGGPNPEDLTVLVEDQHINDDFYPHHMRITDCGCGRLTVYIDDMDMPFLYVDNKYGYVGRTGTILGVGTPGGAAGWVDNVMVEGEPVSIPEPITLLLILGGAVQVVRRLQG